MPFIEWNELLVTGIDGFDDDHRQLVGLLNKAYDDFILGSPNENVAEILNEMLRYAGHHFTAEETWMQQHAYPGLEAHRLEHESFGKSVQVLQDGYNRGKQHISLEVLQFLKFWIRKHLLESDADYSHFNQTVVLPNKVHDAAHT